MSQAKINRVALLFGGRSGEHEVSIRSAESIGKTLQEIGYGVDFIGVDRDGVWRKCDRAAEIPSTAPKCIPPTSPADLKSEPWKNVDVFFPIVHGTFGEDGTLQGMLELAEVAYVGCSVLSSSVGMDKDFTKRIVEAAGIPTAPYHVVTQASPFAEEMKSKFRLPVFVKPANSGSSVGVIKVKNWSDLPQALTEAFLYDSKVLVEQGIEAREIELAVLQSPDPKHKPFVSLAGEVIPTHEFYSYEAKYLDENGAKLVLPAELDHKVLKKCQETAEKVFTVLDAEGMARVDLFLDKKSGEIYFNEINTLPGFTSISMYPKMMEASGVSYPELLTKLLQLAVDRKSRKAKLKRTFDVPKFSPA